MMDTGCWISRIRMLGGRVDRTIPPTYSDTFRQTFDIIGATWLASGRSARNTTWRQMAKDGWLVQGRKVLDPETNQPISYGIEAFRKKRQEHGMVIHNPKQGNDDP
jgi:hypothetical protein